MVSIFNRMWMDKIWSPRKGLLSGPVVLATFANDLNGVHGRDYIRLCVDEKYWQCLVHIQIDLLNGYDENLIIYIGYSLNLDMFDIQCRGHIITTCWSLRCSWSIACRRCSNYIFILDLTPGFSGLGRDDWRASRGTFKFLDLVRLIL